MPNSIIEVNFLGHKDINISISRTDLISRSSRISVPDVVVEKIHQELNTKFPELWTGPYSLINRRRIKPNFSFSIDGYYFRTESHYIKLREIKYPLLVMVNDLDQEKEYYYQNVLTYNFQKEQYFSKFEQIDIDEFELDKLCIVEQRSKLVLRTCLLKTNKLSKINSYRYLGNSAEFPPSWHEILAVKLDPHYIVVNRGHALFKYISEERFLETRGVVTGNSISVENADLFGFIDSIEDILAFLLVVFSTGQEAIWQGFNLYSKPFLANVSKLLQSSGVSIIRFMNSEGGHREPMLHSFSSGDYFKTGETGFLVELSTNLNDSWIIKRKGRQT